MDIFKTLITTGSHSFTCTFDNKLFALFITEGKRLPRFPKTFFIIRVLLTICFPPSNIRRYRITLLTSWSSSSEITRLGEVFDRGMFALVLAVGWERKIPAVSSVRCFLRTGCDKICCDLTLLLFCEPNRSCYHLNVYTIANNNNVYRLLIL